MTTPPDERLVSRWFTRPNPLPDADLRLFCLPYAGGGAAVYRQWQAAFAGPAFAGSGFTGSVEVLPVHLPGREFRLRADPAFDVDEITRAIDAMADRPFALYGHSMGGTIAFEVVRALRSAGRPLPVRLFIGASRAPHLPRVGGFYGLSDLDDGELLARIAAGGGAPRDVLDNAELMELLLPMLRADFTWVDRHPYVEQAPIPVPIVAFAGQEDTAATVAQVDAWAGHTSATFRRHVLPGGHFFLQSDVRELTGIIAAELAAAATASRPARG